MERDEQRVTPLELFFDLVFVFAITQVTSFIATDASWLRLVEGLAILAALWWAWVSYAWLANTANSDEGVMRVVLLAAMAAMLIASLAVPEAFGDSGVVFGIAYLVVRVLHLAAYATLARRTPELGGLVRRLSTTILPAAALLVLAGFLDGTPQAVCWVLALTIDYGGLAARGLEGWSVAPGHFAERHGLIIIVALGESIVALGVGAEGLDLDAGLILAALLGIGAAAALWWAYFDVVAPHAERRLTEATGREQLGLARDSYTYLHLPMMAGIILFAVGVKKTLGHYDEALDGVGAVALCGGVALYLVALSAFRKRNVGTFNRRRLLAAAALLAFAPLAVTVSSLLALAIVAVVTAALIAYEALRFADARSRIRHGEEITLR